MSREADSGKRIAGSRERRVETQLTLSSYPESMSSPGKPQIRSHRDLLVWQRGLLLIKETYRVTTRLPKQEMYGLIAQMRRAAVSIPANIAEGHARHATRDYVRFLAIANGSLRELDTYCEVCALLEYLTEQELVTMQRLWNETASLLMKLRQALVRKLAVR